MGIEAMVAELEGLWAEYDGLRDRYPEAHPSVQASLKQFIIKLHAYERAYDPEHENRE